MPKKFFIFASLLIVTLQVSAAEVRIRLIKNLEKFPQILHAQIIPINARMWAVKGLGLSFGGHKLAKQNMIVQNPDQKFDLIGQFDFDQYLAGVVASEMPDRWPAEALKAQAIVARSFAMARMNERKDKIYQLDNDQMDQVFRATKSARAAAAVKATKNIVLKNQDGKILKAFFHADCGGQTIPASQVWSTETDTGTAVDPWCKARKSNQWSFEIAQDQFQQRLNQLENSPMTVAQIFQQKIQAIQVGDALFSAQKLRQIFGFAKIKNSPESFQLENNVVKISGQGFGHGAGLCQWGALEQAKRGVSALEIIRHYYPKAMILHSESGQKLVSR